MVSAWRRCLNYISIFDRLNSQDCLGSEDSHLNLNAKKTTLIQLFLCLSLSQVITCRVRELHFKGGLECCALHAARAADQR